MVFIYSNHPPTNCINSQGHNHVSKLFCAYPHFAADMLLDRGNGNPDTMIYEMNDALESMMFRWDFCQTNYDRCKPLQGSSSRRRSKGRQSGYELHKRGLNTRIHLAVDSSGMPVKEIITEGTRADCKEAIHLIEGIDAQNLLADHGYDTSEIIAFALSAGMNVVIPPKKNRKVQREYDRYLYKSLCLLPQYFTLKSSAFS